MTTADASTGLVLGILLDRWWGRVRLRRLTAVVAIVLGVAAASIGSQISKPPSDYVVAEGVVESVEKIDPPQAESERATWVKTVDVVVQSGEVWRVRYQDGHEYAAGDSIEMLYDPADPAATLVPEDHEFAPLWATILLVMTFAVMFSVAALIAIGEVWERRRSRA